MDQEVSDQRTCKQNLTAIFGTQFLNTCSYGHISFGTEKVLRFDTQL